MQISGASDFLLQTSGKESSKDGACGFAFLNKYLGVSSSQVSLGVTEPKDR